MFHIILLNPEIPPNTGNIIRLASNSGVSLHIAGNTQFDFSDKNLRRAGLDYHELANVYIHKDLESAYKAAGDGRRFATCPNGDTRFDVPRYQAGDVFVFGCESQGLPSSVLDTFAPSHRLYIPMRANNRSMNLSNSVAVVMMEAWRQLGFCGAHR